MRRYPTPQEILRRTSNLEKAFRSNKPWFMLTRAVLDLVGRTEGRLRAMYANEQALHLDLFATLETTTSWHLLNIPLWEHVNREWNKVSAPKILEIGSWEGSSTRAFLHIFEDSRVTCVDTWQGGDEHQGDSSLSSLEQRFDRNIHNVRDRVTKKKETSIEFYASSDEQVFDIVYVDGSHRSSDVLVDAVCCFDRLKAGGLLIFDDFLWKHYVDLAQNPAHAITAFAKFRSRNLKALFVGSQVVFRKT